MTPENDGSSVQPGADAPVLPMTGNEFLASLHDDREIWIYSERVKDVTTHPAFRNPARMIARHYDSLHDSALKRMRIYLKREHHE